MLSVFLGITFGLISSVVADSISANYDKLLHKALIQIACTLVGVVMLIITRIAIDIMPILLDYTLKLFNHYNLAEVSKWS